jgi:hypothetical protein
VGRTGRSSKVHPEPPLTSLACRQACRTLHHGPAGGPDHHDLIHGATMQPCRTHLPGSGMLSMPVHDETRSIGLSAFRYSKGASQDLR